MRISGAFVLLASCATSAPARPPEAPRVEAPALPRRIEETPPVSDRSDAGSAPATVADASTGAARQRYDEGVAAAGRHEWDAAGRAFGEAFELEPSAELAFDTGRMFEHLAEFDRATEWYRRALQANPSPAVRAQLSSRIGGAERDAQRRREGLAQPPPDDAALSAEASTWFQRGLQLSRRRQWRDALQAFETAQQFVQGAGPNGVPELMFNLGVTHEHLGHRDEAQAAFRSYLDARPDTPDRADIERRIRQLRQQP